MSIRTDVHTTLLSIFTAATYPAVIYDKTSGAMSLGANVLPAAIILNETDMAFMPSQTRREDRRDTSRWAWLVRISFNQEVDLSGLVETLKAVPNINRIRVLIEKAEIIHPPRHDPNTGTKAEFVLNAIYRSV